MDRAAGAAHADSGQRRNAASSLPVAGPQLARTPSLRLTAWARVATGRSHSADACRAGRLRMADAARQAATDGAIEVAPAHHPDCHTAPDCSSLPWLSLPISLDLSLLSRVLGVGTLLSAFLATSAVLCGSHRPVGSRGRCSKAPGSATLQATFARRSIYGVAAFSSSSPSFSGGPAPNSMSSSSRKAYGRPPPARSTSPSASAEFSSPSVMSSSFC